MRDHAGQLTLSATDLSNFLGCRHRTGLEMAAARGAIRKPKWNDPLLDVLFRRGLEHEKAFVASLEADGHRIENLSDIKEPDAAIARTLDAMRAGVEVIVQGALGQNGWYGRPDVMRRVNLPSDLGAWSYEISDTKLARETRAGTLLQLGLYAEMLGVMQGRCPEQVHVVTPDPDAPIHSFRVDDFAAYVRLIRAQLANTVTGDHQAVTAANYPEPVDHCDICPWSSQCSATRRRDDHLSLVAGISRLQRRELEAQNVSTLERLAALPVPLPFKPRRGAIETYLRVREQARLQLESRGAETPIHERREIREGEGLCRLPEPSPGDLFLDLEGDPFAAEGGREYLFGVVTIGTDASSTYRAFWAFNDLEERDAFESVMDLIASHRTHHPGMHVFHYAPYEPSAFKRLIGRYAMRGSEMDTLLREERFVDLYAVVRQGITAGVERYSIKNIEPIYGFVRDVPLDEARRGLLVMEQALELECPDRVPENIRNVVEGYNRDDCVSTHRLRDWLERLRADAIAGGATIPRPAPKDGEATEKVTDRIQRVAALRERLLNGIPAIRDERDEEQQARWLLAYLLDWHRRENSASWWEYYRLRDLPEDDLFDEPRAVAGWVHIERVSVVLSTKGKPTGSVIDRYRYPAQEMEIRAKDDLKLAEGTFGSVVAVDRAGMTIDVRKGRKQADNHPSAVFAHTHVGAEAMEDALFALGETVAEAGRVSSDRGGSARLACSLLLAAAPRLRSGPFRPNKDEDAVAFAVRSALDLDETMLAIQGPPGTGKTYTGAEMICALVKAGRKVGVTANSHKVIRNLLDAVSKAASGTNLPVRLAHKRDGDSEAGDDQNVETIASNEAALEALATGDANVLGGTAWLWARPEFARAIDVLFVDEAGQMALANVLAMSGAAGSIVLLGDPQQLEQPQKGTHPEGVNASALQHVLGRHKTIPPDRGIFLPITWRLPPAICELTSELFYERRLTSKPGLERQRLAGTGDFDGSGLWIAPIAHDGNRNASEEEVDAVEDLVGRLTSPCAAWVDEKGQSRPLKGQDILVVSPYNAQVSRLAERVSSRGVRVGTVDKFQGQEAPIVIYSMATSRPEDAPRGMEFLYSLNRLNVATSRARCAAIVVASPRLFEPECRTPRQMKLANALCRLRELATIVDPGV